MRMRLVVLSILFGAYSIGCTSKTPEPPKKPGVDAKQADAEVAHAFRALQAAIKAKDAETIWDLLAKESQGDAEREAKVVKEAFGKANDKDKAEYEKKLELTARELADITGKLYVKSRRFYGKYHEIPDSKVEKIAVTGESGTVKYIEEDGDKITQEVVREQGKWKFVMAIPKATEK
jgi:hypothetical protein